MRIKRMATAVALVACWSAAPVAAQTPPGEVVKELAKMHAAQTAFFKKLASDANFAAQFHQAMAKKDYDGAATLVAGASGLARANIAVSGPEQVPSSSGAAAFDGESSPRILAASFESHRGGPRPLPSSPSARRLATTGKVCFFLFVVAGCVYW